VRLLISGSRHYTDYSEFTRLLWQELNYEIDQAVTEVISGGARGIDSLAVRWAQKTNVPFKVFNADWKRYGKVAGPKRNEEMCRYVSLSNGWLIAFWDGSIRNSGTANAILNGFRYGLNVRVVLI